MALSKVQSAAIDAVEYNPETKTLDVHWKNGGHYSYKNVHQNTYDNFMKAPSKTNFVKAHIHDRHEVSKHKGTSNVRTSKSKKNGVLLP